MSGSERQRRYRTRLRTSACCFRGDVPREVVLALIRTGWLTPGDERNPGRLGEVIADLADCWARGTLGALGRRTTTRNSKARR